MHSLKDLRKVATQEECELLASACDTTPTYLFSHLAVHRNIGIKKAVQIELATTALNERTGGRTPVIPRTQTCEECSKCPHAKG